MLGYSCLAHSYWQRCHKTGLRGALSGEEEEAEKLTRRGPYACAVVCSPQALSLSLSPHPLTPLHHPLLCQGYKCQDIRLPQAVSLALPPEQHHVRLVENGIGSEKKGEEKKQLVKLRRAMSRNAEDLSFSCCQLNDIPPLVMDLVLLLLFTT